MTSDTKITLIVKTVKRFFRRRNSRRVKRREIRVFPIKEDAVAGNEARELSGKTTEKAKIF